MNPSSLRKNQRAERICATRDPHPHSHRHHLLLYNSPPPPVTLGGPVCSSLRRHCGDRALPPFLPGLDALALVLSLDRGLGAPLGRCLGSAAAFRGRSHLLEVFDALLIPTMNPKKRDNIENLAAAVAAVAVAAEKKNTEAILLKFVIRFGTVEKKSFVHFNI